VARKLYLCRIEHEFVVCADDLDDASDVAEEARMEEIDMTEARVVREIIDVSDLGRWRRECPYGDDARTCQEILESDGEVDDVG
jgi:hypothetical protein